MPCLFINLRSILFFNQSLNPYVFTGAVLNLHLNTLAFEKVNVDHGWCLLTAGCSLETLPPPDFIRLPVVKMTLPNYFVPHTHTRRGPSVPGTNCSIMECLRNSFLLVLPSTLLERRVPGNDPVRNDCPHWVPLGFYGLENHFCVAVLYPRNHSIKKGLIILKTLLLLMILF